MVETAINEYHVRIVDENNRINALIEECEYDVYGVPHIDLNEFVEKLVEETIVNTMIAVDSGFSPNKFVKHHFGIE